MKKIFNGGKINIQVLVKEKTLKDFIKILIACVNIMDVSLGGWVLRNINLKTKSIFLQTMVMI